ncbi:MAG TPA: ABC transporter ATP-binding protein [Rhizomicrobium sp.]|jgi:lipopolysaccharide transport system ATP-binding protein|nr:ABC transporter ATP-binding protein [Rhizomicrobium sp.]
MSSEPVIQTRGLGKAYPIYLRPEDRLKQLLWGRWRRYYHEYWAVRGVDLSVSRAETVGIIGRNGSGKSTLLQMICGTLRPSAGEVRVRGRVAAMLELGSGFNPEFTGRENIRLGAAVLGLGAEEIEARFEAIAAFADIGAFMDQPLKHYSSGMHARLAFAVCANVDADILVVDEVLSVGDAAFQQKCMRFLNRFRMHGTLLFVSHDSGAIVKLCDRALWLDQGLVRGLGPAKEMCRIYLAAQAEDATQDSTRFRLGGRNAERPAPEATEPARPYFAEPAIETDRLVFETDDELDAQGGVEIESIGFYGLDNICLRVAAGGEAAELRIVCCANRPIAHVAVAFAVRDRLGQVLFADDTHNGSPGAERAMSNGQRFVAKFDFLLPYLASGPYAIEAFVFERKLQDFVLLQRQMGSEFLYVQSIHPSSGLANVAMRGVFLEIQEGSKEASATTDFERAELHLATGAAR